MTEPNDQNEIDQQQRIILSTKASTTMLLNALDQIAAWRRTYDNLGLADDNLLHEESFNGTGTDREDYRAAIVSFDALSQLLASGHGTNLERFAR